MRLFLFIAIFEMGIFASSVSAETPDCEEIEYKRACNTTVTTNSGNVYTGQFEGGIFKGKAASGAEYNGGIKDGKWDGQATYTSADGNTYVGEWKGGKRDGQGTYTWADGVTYVGEWKEGKYDGQGTYTQADVFSYVGAYKDGKRHGQGTLTYEDGATYVGAWKDDKRDGQGTLARADGSILQEGLYKEDQLVGETPDCEEIEYKRTCSTTVTGGFGEEVFAGQFKEGVFKGKTCDRYDICREYNGGIKDGKLHGQGTLTWVKNGSNYVGEWKDGERNGQGIFTYEDGTTYAGEWKDGEFDGQGTYTEPWGDSYVGAYKDGERDGQGTLTRADGSIVQEGLYKKGQLVGETPDCEEVEYKNACNTTVSFQKELFTGQFEGGVFKGKAASGVEYNGGMKDGKWDGQGTLTQADVFSYVGAWKDGDFDGQGTLTMTNVFSYVGAFKDGEFDGQGTLTGTDGQVEEGLFKKGKLVRTIGKAGDTTSTKTFVSAEEKYSDEIVAHVAKQYGMYQGIDNICGNSISLKEFQKLVGKAQDMVLEEDGVDESLWDDVKDKAWDNAVIPQDLQMVAQALSFSQAYEKTIYCNKVVAQMIGLFTNVIQKFGPPSGKKERDF